MRSGTVDHPGRIPYPRRMGTLYYGDNLNILRRYFRPNKKWDFIVVVEGQLVAAREAKSQVGPSFGNNFNNRTEEATTAEDSFRSL